MSGCHDYWSLVRHEGNLSLFRAVEMSILSQLAGTPLHIHVEGLRGTGKTTIMRAAKSILPKIRRVRGCPYNCRPEAPHCPEHRDLDPEEVAAIGVELVDMPLLEISHSAKVGTVVGTIDLSRLLDPSKPEAALMLGTIPRANRGIIFIDEINRLADTSPELTDILLDIMGTKPGRIQIEEAGLPVVELPVEVSVWAASNPDEDPGPLEEIRRQMSDRFDFVIEMGRIRDPRTVRQILASADELTSKQSTCRADSPVPARPNYAERLTKGAETYSTLAVEQAIEELLAGIYVDFGLESLRAVAAARVGARALAALEGRRTAGLSDLKAVLPWVLRHRVDPGTITAVMRYVDEAAARASRREGEGRTPAARPGTVAGAGAPALEHAPDSRAGDLAQNGQAAGESGSSGSGPDAAGLSTILSRLFQRLRADQEAHSDAARGDAGRFGSSRGPSGQEGHEGQGAQNVGASGNARQGHGAGSEPAHPEYAVTPREPAKPVSELSWEEMVRSEEELNGVAR